ncbi:hypothetical protein K438DRAFT_1178863 [Mycena galopus ATCC 62051]|nr:hypothetical protein K438DRAFT_1178863 [Mycena galopus ATCC 62051]
MAQNKAQQLLELAADSQITQFAAVASLTILAFDCVISLQREVEMVWKRSKSPVKWLYIWNRYFTLAMTSFFTSVVLRQTPSNEVIASYTIKCRAQVLQ